MPRYSRTAWSFVVALTFVLLLGNVRPIQGAQSDVVLYASDIPASAIHGAWTFASDLTSPNGTKLSTPTSGQSSMSAPLASPVDYVDVTFTGNAGTPYTFWTRLEAFNNSKASDSVWVQFSDALVNGTPIYPLNTTSALLVKLATDRTASSDINWGWVNSAYWLTQPATVTFATSGIHTVRVQVRGAGVKFDQIVLSPSTYLTAAPGVRTNDSRIVPKPSDSPPGSTPYSGSPVSLPGLVEAENFDDGGEGVAYHDIEPENLGHAYRDTGVDIEPALGGYDVGWVGAGEWLNYTVMVTAAGSYDVAFRVASFGQGGSFHLEMNGANVTGEMTVPNTGGWQNWQPVTRTVTLAAGTQIARLVMEANGVYAVGNFDSFTFSSSSGGGSGPAAPNSPNPPGGTAGVTVAPTLSWTSAGATSYDLLLGSTSTPSAYVSNITTSWYSTSQLTAGTTYYWQVLARNSSGTTPGPVWSFRTDGSSSGGGGGTAQTFRLMQWNVQSGKDINERYDPWSQVQLMASQGADIICLEEVETWMADEPTLFKTYLEQVTGQTWYAVYAPNTPNAGTIGDLLLSRFPIAQQNAIIMKANPGDPSDYLGNLGALRALININGVPVNIIGTHLEYANTSYRTTQLGILLAWAASFGGPRLMAGDFNSWWGEYWIVTVLQTYSDTWQDITGSNQNGHTIGNVRFDYIFRSFDQSSHVTPTNVWVVPTTLSDHNPVLADFRVQ
jgi:endonuclease/exonuclease/phosphatase family metal-dependent hydrolase